MGLQPGEARPHVLITAWCSWCMVLSAVWAEILRHAAAYHTEYEWWIPLLMPRDTISEEMVMCQGAWMKAGRAFTM